jgi:hypothetical protein
MASFSPACGTGGKVHANACLAKVSGMLAAARAAVPQRALPTAPSDPWLALHPCLLLGWPHCPTAHPTCPALHCPASLLQCAGDGVRFECSVLGNPDACQDECARAAGKETNFEVDDGSPGGPAGDAACQACAMSKAPAAPQCSMAGVVFESACHLKVGGCIA